MKRRVSGVEFATVWGKVSRWAQPDRNDLVELLNDMDATKATDAVLKKMNLRKPKPGTPEGVKP